MLAPVVCVKNETDASTSSFQLLVCHGQILCRYTIGGRRQPRNASRRVHYGSPISHRPGSALWLHATTSWGTDPGQFGHLGHSHRGVFLLLNLHKSLSFPPATTCSFTPIFLLCLAYYFFSFSPVSFDMPFYSNDSPVPTDENVFDMLLELAEHVDVWPLLRDYVTVDDGV